jgi:hypothetical protein
MRGLGSEAFDGQFCFGGGPGFIVGVQGDFVSAPSIWRKSMSDTTWRLVGPSYLLGGSFLGVSAPSANVIYVCGTNGMIYKSTDGGDTWADQTTQTTRNLNAISFCDEKHGFAVGDSGLILHTSTGGPTSAEVRQSSPPTGFVLAQNYPNPFNPSTTIRFELPQRSHVRLTIHNVLGQQIAQLVDEDMSAGYYQRTWNARVASGMYLYWIDATATDNPDKHFVDAKKLILLK